MCRPSEEGGLGIRDITAFNEALMLKLVWNLAANKDKIWVAIMKAKYFPRGGFWGIQTSTRASKAWKEVQWLKEFFKETMRWQIGDGKEVCLVNQPWLEEWAVQRITTNVQRDTTVAEVFDSRIGAWREDNITQLLGQQAMNSILLSVKQPREHALLPDRLIWTSSDNGIYTAKDGYMILAKGQHRIVNYDDDQKFLWKEMWNWKGMIPRVLIFIWRACMEE